MRYQIMTFLIAGHETTSSLLSFALYFLINHPSVLAKAYEEVDRVLGKDLRTEPTYEQVHQLQYLSQTLKESLRLCPPVGLFSRRVFQNHLLGGRYEITPDDLLSVHVPLLHRDRSVWGDAAEVFDPDSHFNPDAETARPANAFKPFGTGQRSCLGRPFALQEAALVLGMILQRYLPFTPRTYQLAVKEAGAMKPLDFVIKVKPRPQVEQESELLAPGDGVVAKGREQPHPEVSPQSARVAESGKLLVLYGSNMGTSEELAHQISEDARAKGLTATVGTLDDYVDWHPTQEVVIIVVSSYNGAPPDNAATFCRWLHNGLAPDALQGVQYALFGCGNRDWAATYQAIPQLIDQQLEQHGATRLSPRGEGNAAGDFDGQFQKWSTSLWKTLMQVFSLEGMQPAHPQEQVPLYEVEILRHPHPYPFVNSFGALPMMVLANRELAGGDGARSVRHVQVALAPEVSYRTGDHLGVVASNGPVLVKRVADHFHFDEQTVVRLHMNQKQGRKEIGPLDEPISVYDGLANYAELQDVAKCTHIRRMVQYTSDEAERQHLESLSGERGESAATYQREILDKRKSLIDLLEEHPSCALPFNIYLECLMPLRPRYYSISSSPSVVPDECSITVGVVKGPAKSGHGEFAGTCSNYL